MARAYQRNEFEENALGHALVRTVDYVKDNPWVIAAAIGAVATIGVGIYLLDAAHGDNVVIYLSEGTGAGEFRETGGRIARNIGASLYPARNAQDILDAVRRHRRIKTLVLAGHGTTTQFLRPGTAGIRVTGGNALPTWMSTRTFAREVAPRMAISGDIGWAGCSAASNPGESQWSYASYGPGGEYSFIANVRDEMAAVPGTLWGIEHHGHSAPGQASANPGARTCPVSRSAVGEPCESVLDETWGEGAYTRAHRQWAASFTGLPAERWLSGQEFSVPPLTAGVA